MFLLLREVRDLVASRNTIMATVRAARLPQPGMAQICLLCGARTEAPEVHTTPDAEGWIARTEDFQKGVQAAELRCTLRHEQVKYYIPCHRGKCS